MKEAHTAVSAVGFGSTHIAGVSHLSLVGGIERGISQSSSLVAPRGKRVARVVLPLEDTYLQD